MVYMLTSEGKLRCQCLSSLSPHTRPAGPQLPETLLLLPSVPLRALGLQALGLLQPVLNGAEPLNLGHRTAKQVPDPLTQSSSPGSVVFLEVT